MGSLEKFPFIELDAEGIKADWDPLHPPVCDSKCPAQDTAPEATIGLRLQLRSDSPQAKAERKEWPARLLQFKSLKILSVNGATPELFQSICKLPSLLKLSIVRGRVPELDGLEALVNLTHFYFCGNPALHLLIA